MSRTLILPMTLLGLSVFSIIVEGNDAGQILLSEKAYDFGTIRGSSTRELRHSFTLQNVSNREVMIRRIESSCRCTTLRLKEACIKPQSSVQIVANLDISGIEGEKRAIVRVEFNDRSFIDISLKVAVWAAAKAVPEKPAFEMFEGRSGAFNIDVYKASPLHTNSYNPDRIALDSSFSSVKCAIRQAQMSPKKAGTVRNSPASVYSIDLFVKPLPKGLYRSDLNVRFADGGDLTIPVQINVLPSAFLVPGRIFCGGVKKGEVRSATMRFISSIASQITGIQCQNKDFRFRAGAQSEDGSIPIMVIMPWNNGCGFCKIEGVVVSNNPQIRRIPFAIVGFVE